MTVTEQLDKLKPEERAALIRAFEDLNDYCVNLPDGTYVGVHLTPNANRQEMSVEGFWSTGVVK